MPSVLDPYISFRDNARQAMEFYRDASVASSGSILSASTAIRVHLGQTASCTHSLKLIKVLP